MLRKKILPVIFTIAFFAITFIGCKQKEEAPQEIIVYDLDEIQASDTLRVATMYGSTSYYEFRKNQMGYDYDLVSNLANYLKVELKLIIAQTEQQLIQMLDSGEVDLVAYNMVETRELKEKFMFTFPEFDYCQVLVQNGGRNSIKSTTDLAGKDVYVKENTALHQRLKNLNEEIGGTINIILAPDSLTNDNLIEMVITKQIPYTVAFSDRAEVYNTYYRNLDFGLPLSFGQHSGWIMRKDMPKLLDALNTWKELPKTKHTQQLLEGKYRQKSLYISLHKIRIPEGYISPYDDLFKKYAPRIDWDWQLLASIAYHESTYDTTLVSRAGAKGLMQLMPATYYKFGLDSATVFQAEPNIRVAVEHLNEFERMFIKRVPEKSERIKFILAAYNAGQAHIFDAIALAKRYGRDPQVWFDNVEYFLSVQNDPEFYNDSVVKYGRFNPRETLNYVENTLNTYEKFLKKSDKSADKK